ncbi:MAG: hypothetical protein ACE5DX_02635 [Candidatus Dojkabacteria bacterium]
MQKSKLHNPLQLDPGNLSEKERAAESIVRLPTNLCVAIKEFKKSKVIRNTIGGNLATSYLAVKSAEWKAMKDMTLKEEVEILLEKY